MAFSFWPFTNLHDLNLDWIVQQIKFLKENMGTRDYNDQTHKPSINHVELQGELSGSDLGLADASSLTGKQDKLTAGQNITITGDTISATDTTYTAGENIQITGTEISCPKATYRAGANINIDPDTNTISASGTIAGVSANRGLSVDSQNKIGHDNTPITAGSKGSVTKVPVITFDQYGHITAAAEVTIYPPTTAGTNGQYWMSDGSGAGQWKTPGSVSAGSNDLVSGDSVNTAIAGKFDTAGSGLTSTGSTVKHSNSIEAGSAGSATKIPSIQYDSTGHITAASEVTAYPPTSAGEAGQVWTSTGSGSGSWQSPASGTQLLREGSFSDNAVETYNVVGKKAFIVYMCLPTMIDETSTVSANNWSSWMITPAELATKKYFGCYFGGAGPYRISAVINNGVLTLTREGSAAVSCKVVAL